jgi:hypothetical protein
METIHFAPFGNGGAVKTRRSRKRPNDWENVFQPFEYSRPFASVRGFVLCIWGISWFVSRAAVSPHPNILWQAEKPFDSYTVEIASDAEFKNVVDCDTIDNIARYVPAKPLPPGEYFWRVNESQNGMFEIQAPEHEIIVPSGGGMAEIRTALAAARTNGSACIRFEPGEYHLRPGDEGTVFEANGITNLIIDGGGASFVIHDIARLAEVEFSKHITFRNFTVDYDVPIYTAARVDSVSADGALELSLRPGCVSPETVPRFMEEKHGMFYEPQFPRMAENVPLVVAMKEAWQPLGGNRYRLHAIRPEDIRNVRPGMVYICAPRHKPQGIELYHSDDVTLADITTYYLPGIGVVTSFVNDLKLIRLNLLRRKDRLLGVQNGGTNIHNARIGPWVEGCRFENTGDDNNHISALVLTPVAQPDSKTVVVSSQQPGTRVFFPDTDIQRGDRLAFFIRTEGGLLAEATVVSANVIGQNTTIGLDREIPEMVCGTGQDNPDLKTTQVYDLSRACGNFVFRNNTFIRGRRAGILAKSGPGLIENNRFEELGGGGVEIWNAPFEGLYAHDILIQNNLFRRGGLVHKNTGPAPAVWVEIFGGNPSQPLHRNLRIMSNRIVDYPGNGIEICDAQDVRIERNYFDFDQLDALRQTDACLIKLVNVRKERVDGNRLQDRRFNQQTPDCCSGVINP